MEVSQITFAHYDECRLGNLMQMVTCMRVGRILWVVVQPMPARVAFNYRTQRSDYFRPLLSDSKEFMTEPVLFGFLETLLFGVYIPINLTFIAIQCCIHKRERCDHFRMGKGEISGDSSAHRQPGNVCLLYAKMFEQGAQIGGMVVRSVGQTRLPKATRIISYDLVILAEKINLRLPHGMVKRKAVNKN